MYSTNSSQDGQIIEVGRARNFRASGGLQLLESGSGRIGLFLKLKIGPRVGSGFRKNSSGRVGLSGFRKNAKLSKFL